MQDENVKEKIELVSRPDEPISNDKHSSTEQVSEDLNIVTPGDEQVSDAHSSNAQAQDNAHPVSSSENTSDQQTATSDEHGRTDLPSLGERYEALEVIGYGGMGTVFKARDKTTGSIVAIKVLKKELTRDKTALRRFEQEVASLAELDHANLVTLFGQGHTTDGAPYLVMEYIEGKSLASILEEEKKLSPERAIDLVLQITEGLAHAHKKGIVHRDLKPSNIMIHRPAEKFENEALNGASHQAIETVRILDFGIARIVESTTGSTTGLTQTGDVFGTPNYMSPEQCEGKPIDSVSDIYSLGCILYELLTGKLPFEGSNPIQVAVKHINEKAPIFPVEKRKRLKQPLKSLESITLFCMGKNKNERYQTIEELAADLRKVKAGKRVTKSAEHGRSPYLNNNCGAAIGVFLGSFFIFGLFNPSYILQTTPIISTDPKTIAALFLCFNLFPTFCLTYCVFKDRATFRNSNRTMNDFWNLLESSSFAISIWAMMLLYALSLSIYPASASSGLLTTPLAAVALVSGMIGMGIELSFLIVNRMKKQLLDIPFSRKSARNQTIAVYGGSILSIALMSIYAPFLVQTVIDGTAMSLVHTAPHTAGALTDAALILTPESTKALECKTIAELALDKNTQEVLQTINKAIAKSPMNAEFYAIRAQTYFALDEGPNAITDYTNAIRYDDKAEYFKARARVNASFDREWAALSDYSEALNREPTDVDLYTTRGLLYAKVKDFKPAIQDLSTAMASAPRYKRGEALLRRGIVYELAGDQIQATQDYKQALRDKDDLGYLCRTFLYKRLNMKAQYEKELETETRPPGELRDELSDILFGDTVDLPFEW